MGLGLFREHFMAMPINYLPSAVVYLTLLVDWGSPPDRIHQTTWGFLKAILGCLVKLVAALRHNAVPGLALRACPCSRETRLVMEQGA